MAQGIILAGGLSSRAKTNKVLLTYRGKTFLENALDTMSSFLDLVVVVSGKYHDDALNIAKNYPNVIVVRNLRYEEGMFTSVKTGVSKMSDDFFILPVDCPLVKKETFKRLMVSNHEMSVPTYLGHNGHPLFLKKNLINCLLNENDESNLRLFRDKHDCEYIEVDDKNIILDIDTKQEYEKLLEAEDKE